jgi:hypothetical protein
MSSSLWSPDEDERLRNLARSGSSLTEIAHEIQRPKSSVHVSAARLKIVIARESQLTVARLVAIGLRAKK